MITPCPAWFLESTHRRQRRLALHRATGILSLLLISRQSLPAFAIRFDPTSLPLRVCIHYRTRHHLLPLLHGTRHCHTSFGHNYQRPDIRRIGHINTSNAVNITLDASRIRCITIPAHAFVQTFRNNHVVGINHSRIPGMAGLASLDYCARERIRHHWLVVAHTATCHFY